MKKVFYSIAVLAIAVGTTSCYSLSYSVGSGSQTGEVVKGHNHYLIGGLIPVAADATPEKLAGGASNYDVKVTHTFVDGALGWITGQVYTPTTVIVKK